MKPLAQFFECTDCKSTVVFSGGLFCFGRSHYKSVSYTRACRVGSRTSLGNANRDIHYLAQDTVLKEHLEAHLYPIGFLGYQLGPTFF